MPSVARVTYIPLRAPAVNVIAICSRSRRIRHKPDRMTTVEPLIDCLYSLDELTELRRTLLRYARYFPPGAERNQHLQIAVSLRRLFRNEKWLAAYTIKGSQSASMLANRSSLTRWRLRRPAFFSRVPFWSTQ
jgi:hypothetical protein